MVGSFPSLDGAESRTVDEQALGVKQDLLWTDGGRTRRLSTRLRTAALHVLVAMLVTYAGLVFLMRHDSPPHDAMGATWTSYEYIGTATEGTDVKHPIVHTATDAEWSIDWPENPDSILALLTYRTWSGHVPLDLTDASVTIRTSGELELHGGYMRFWVLAGANRWHLDHPIPVGESVTLDLSADGPWQQSWARISGTIEGTLAGVDSYGLAFVGFDEEVTGWLRLEQMHFD